MVKMSNFGRAATGESERRSITAGTAARNEEKEKRGRIVGEVNTRHGNHLLFVSVGCVQAL